MKTVLSNFMHIRYLTQKYEIIVSKPSLIEKNYQFLNWSFCLEREMMQLISQIQSPLAFHINHDTTLLKKDHIEVRHRFFVSNNVLLHVETYLKVDITPFNSI